MRNYSMKTLYSELYKHSEFILTQLAACSYDNWIVSQAAKRVLIMKQSHEDLKNDYELSAYESLGYEG